MPNSDELAFRSCAERNALEGLRPVAVGGEHLASAEDELDWATDQLGGNRRDGTMGPRQTFATETSAHKWVNDPHFGLVNSQSPSIVLRAVGNALSCIVGSELITIPHG